MTRPRVIALAAVLLGGYLLAFLGGVAWDRHVQARVLQQAREIIESQADAATDDGEYGDDASGDDPDADAGDDGDDAGDGGACGMPADEGETVSL